MIEANATPHRMAALPVPKPGTTLRHFNGTLYRVMDYAAYTHLLSDLLLTVVRYCTVEPATNRIVGQPFVRPAAEFQHEVYIDGRWIPRYEDVTGTDYA